MATATPPIRKYRLLHSQHIARNPLFDPKRPVGEDNKKSVVFQPGDVVEGVDLDRRHPNKFVALDPYAVVQPAVPVKGKPDKGEKTDLDKEYGDLDKMDLDELKEVAASEEIDLGTATTKADVLKKLRGK